MAPRAAERVVCPRCGKVGVLERYTSRGRVYLRVRHVEGGERRLCYLGAERPLRRRGVTGSAATALFSTTAGEEVPAAPGDLRRELEGLRREVEELRAALSERSSSGVDLPEVRVTREDLQALELYYVKKRASEPEVRERARRVFSEVFSKGRKIVSVEE
jgi:hypothetical protein